MFVRLHSLDRAADGAIGVVVSIVASQAIDPGSIPGWRTAFFTKPQLFFWLSHQNRVDLLNEATRAQGPTVSEHWSSGMILA